MSLPNREDKNGTIPPKTDDNVREEALRKLEAKKIELEIKQSERAEKRENSAFNFGGAKRRVKRSAVWLILILIIITPLIVFYFEASSSHSGPFNYTFEAYYTSVFAPIGSFISPLTSLISSQSMCIFNPINCVGQQNVNITKVVYPTFTSFVSFTPASNPQTAFLTGNNTPVNLYYDVENTANIPLGFATNNALVLNESCGSTNNPPAAHICTATTSPTTMLSNANFVSALLAGATTPNQTTVSVSCPLKNSQISLPTLASIILNFTIKNYSAASLFPIQFVSKQFDQQLSLSSQALIPNQPSISFVSPGPVQVTMSAVEPLPILTDSGNVPILIAIKNKGSGNNGYKINSLSLFVPKSLWPSNPQSTGWNCSTSTHSIKMQFALPGSSYWMCTTNASSQQLESSGAQFVLPQLTSLSTMHFDTVPILAYINYDYYEYSDMPYIIRSSGSVCG